MALNTNLAKAVAKAVVDAAVDLMDGGTAGNPTLKILAGAQPASPDTGSGTTLATIDLGTAAVFGAATTGTGGDAGYITATASSILPKTDTSATASGTAAWFRAFNKDATAIISGSVGTNSTTADLVLDNTSITAGQEVKLNSWKVRFPYK